MLIKNYFLFAILIISIFFTACSTNNEPVENTANINSNTVVANNETTPEPVIENSNVNTETPTQAVTCAELKRKDFALDKKQTVAFDFPPFEKSCFAVFHDPDFTNPALGAQYFIYKDGKQVFQFPEQFNGGNTTCWVDAVSFEDVNTDKLQDIIVIGKCGGKSDPYNENMVYINTGTDFKVNKDANMEMMDFSKVSQVKDYVREHQESFAK